jgi:hypothetical protein
MAIDSCLYTHRIGHILTRNVSDFIRFPGLTALLGGRTCRHGARGGGGAP